MLSSGNDSSIKGKIIQVMLAVFIIAALYNPAGLPDSVVSFLFFITIVIYVVFITIGWDNIRSLFRRDSLSFLNRVACVPAKDVNGFKEFIRNNPGFDENRFKTKIDIAFRRINEAISNEDLSPVRKFISDGVYQRYNTGFKLMKLLGLRSDIEKAWIRNMYIAGIDTDGLFDVIHVALLIKKTENIKSSMYSSLNSRFNGEYIEFWSFIKKRNPVYYDLYSTVECPGCGSVLSDNMGEVSRCSSCGILTNSGVYDWVLSEITHADDFNVMAHYAAKDPGFNERIWNILAENEDFSVQLLEDKAANAYLQILTSIVLKNPAMMRRFVSDSLFEKIKSRMELKSFIYSRLDINDSSVVGITETKKENIIYISVKVTYRRARLNNKTLADSESMPMSRTEVLVMCRNKDAALTGYNIYQHECPGCGSPVNDTLDIACASCGSVLNSPSYGWIVQDILNISEYLMFKENEKNIFKLKNPEAIDQLYSVRDYALNNIMVIIGSDGIFDEKEKVFAHSLARKWGYDINRIENFFNLAAGLKLSIRMPESVKKRRMIYELMLEAAEIDGSISPVEQRRLDIIKKEYNIDI